MEDQTSAALMQAATTEAKELLASALTELKDTLNSGNAEKLPDFFPHGIELIYIHVEVSPVTVELRVAGPNGGTAIENVTNDQADR